MKRSRSSCRVVLTTAGILLSVALASSGRAATIATFADPALDGSTPLFTIDLTVDRISGGWSSTGLTLEVPVSGNTFSNACFTMTDLTYTGSSFIGTSGPGTIKFFKQGDSITATPLIQIAFDSAQLSVGGLGGDDILSSNNVVITGSEISGTLYEETFAFSFANHQLSANRQMLTTTAAFTSSALPEPASMLLLSLGIPMIWRRKHRPR